MIVFWPSMLKLLRDLLGWSLVQPAVRVLRRQTPKLAVPLERRLGRRGWNGCLIGMSRALAKQILYVGRKRGTPT
jgi:hypothetical protein